MPTIITEVMRPGIFLAPEDSVFRAIEYMRASASSILPVVDDLDRLIGVVGWTELKPLADGLNANVIYEPIKRYARSPLVTARTDWRIQQVRDALKQSSDALVVVLDENDRFVGTVTIADLLVPASIPPRPASVGGMATPWGVYLTSGYIQAGASNLSLALSGIILGVLLIGSHAMVGVVAMGIQHVWHIPAYALWRFPQPNSMSLMTVCWFALQALSLLVFALAMRLVSLTGYHAAEHQAVHAMERGEPLHPSVVKRMPRVHPRCGTNLMAGGLVFVAVAQVVGSMRAWGLDSSDGAILGALASFLSWRKAGSLMQLWFTTKPPSDKQLAAGIAAAEELQRKYLTCAQPRQTAWRRLWCMGLPQTAVGVAVATYVITYIFIKFMPMWAQPLIW